MLHGENNINNGEHGVNFGILRDEKNIIFKGGGGTVLIVVSTVSGHSWWHISDSCHFCNIQSDVAVPPVEGKAAIAYTRDWL